MMKKLLLAAALLLGIASQAFAGSSTIGATPGSGALYDVITDGSGHFVAMVGICDGAAAAQCAGVQSNAAGGTTGSNNLAVISYGYLWNGAAWVQATPSAIGSSLSSAGISVTPPSDWAGTIGKTAVVQIFPPVTITTTYTIGHGIGGLISFPNAGRGPNNAGVIQAASLTFKEVQTAAKLNLYIFDSNPNTSGSACADNGALTIATADSGKVRAIAHFINPLSELGTGHTTYQLDLTQWTAKPFSGTTTLYGCLVATTVPTAQFASTSDVGVALEILGD